jgi:hypothetical protein
LVSKCVKVLSGIAAPFTDVTALGFAEPELVERFGEAEGLGEAVDAEFPEAVVAVTVPEELVVSAVEASADRT